MASQSQGNTTPRNEMSPGRSSPSRACAEDPSLSCCIMACTLVATSVPPARPLVARRAQSVGKPIEEELALHARDIDAAVLRSALAQREHLELRARGSNGTRDRALGVPQRNLTVVFPMHHEQRTLELADGLRQIPSGKDLDGLLTR